MSQEVAISRSLVAEKRSAVMPSDGGSSSGCPSAVDAIDSPVVSQQGSLAVAFPQSPARVLESCLHFFARPSAC